MDISVDQHQSVDYSVTYKGSPFVCRGEFSPIKDDWYYVLYEEDESIFGCYCEFKDGIWLEGLGLVIYWQENI